MMDITVTENNIHIPEGYQYGKKGFSDILYWLHELHPECKVYDHRSIRSMSYEWSTHNALYALGIARKRTADVDINWPMKKAVEILYNIIGVIVWPFIR